MANRSIQQKIRKIKKRGRYVQRSGGVSKFHNHWDEDGLAYVGTHSFTKQVINTGRGPDPERMQQYYSAVAGLTKPLPKTKGRTGPMQELVDNYERIVKETPALQRIHLVKNELGSLDLCFAQDANQFFFIDIDVKTKTIRRSKIYASRKFAMKMLELKSITWVESVLPK